MTVDHAEVHEQSALEKTFLWPQVARGDCRQDDARLIIRSDGTAMFTSRVWTHTHGVDFWFGQIKLRGANGAELGHSDEIRSAAMPHDHDGPENFKVFGMDFKFPPENFAQVTAAEEICRC